MVQYFGFGFEGLRELDQELLCDGAQRCPSVKFGYAKDIDVLCVSLGWAECCSAGCERFGGNDI
jgi:hypothetical protein